MNRFKEVSDTNAILLEYGDFIEKMYGYITVFSENIYVLKGIGFAINGHGASAERERGYIYWLQ